MRRSGTRYTAEVKSSSVKSRLKLFRFSTTQAYPLELAANAMRFYRNQGQITVANTDAAVTNGTFPTNITGWTNRSTGLGSIAHDATNLDLDLIPGGTARNTLSSSVSVAIPGTRLNFRLVPPRRARRRWPLSKRRSDITVSPLRRRPALSTSNSAISARTPIRQFPSMMFRLSTTRPWRSTPPPASSTSTLTTGSSLSRSRGASTAKRSSCCPTRSARSSISTTCGSPKS